MDTAAIAQVFLRVLRFLFLFFFSVSVLRTAAATNVPANAGFLCDEDAVLADTIKETSCILLFLIFFGTFCILQFLIFYCLCLI